MKRRHAKRAQTLGSHASMGPVSLNVGMAQAHGWSDKALERAWKALEAVARRESGYARRRHPERYKKIGGVVVYIGPLPGGNGLRQIAESLGGEL